MVCLLRGLSSIIYYMYEGLGRQPQRLWFSMPQNLLIAGASSEMGNR